MVAAVLGVVAGSLAESTVGAGLGLLVGGAVDSMLVGTAVSGLVGMVSGGVATESGTGKYLMARTQQRSEACEHS